MSSKDIVRAEAQRTGWSRDAAVSMSHDDRRDVFRRGDDVLHVRYDSLGRCYRVRLNGVEQRHENRKIVLDVLR